MTLCVASFALFVATPFFAEDATKSTEDGAKTENDALSNKGEAAATNGTDTDNKDNQSASSVQSEEGEEAAKSVKALPSVPTKKEKPPKPVVAKLGSKKWTLLPPKTCPKIIDLTAGISGTFGKTAVDFNVAYTVSEEAARLVIMDDFMVTLGEVVFDGTVLTNTCPILSADLAAAILCDMEFLYYEDEVLSAAIAPLKMRLLVHKTGETTFRIVMTKDKSLRQLQLTDEGVTIDNFTQKYHYTFTVIDDKSTDKPKSEEMQKSEEAQKNEETQKSEESTPKKSEAS